MSSIQLPGTWFQRVFRYLHGSPFLKFFTSHVILLHNYTHLLYLSMLSIGIWKYTGSHGNKSCNFFIHALFAHCKYSLRPKFVRAKYLKYCCEQTWNFESLACPHTRVHIPQQEPRFWWGLLSWRIWVAIVFGCDGDWLGVCSQILSYLMIVCLMINSLCHVAV